MAKRMTGRFQVVSLTLLCAFVLGIAPMPAAAREQPKEKPSVSNRRVVQLDDIFVLKRSCEKPNKGVSQRFGTPSFLKETTNDCSGWCNCTECYCESDEGLRCCADGCEACWAVLDEGGGCAM
jgi:hypothetical protein